MPPNYASLIVTNRDGVQTSIICLSKLQKTMLNLYLNEMGIYQSDFGFPVTITKQLSQYKYQARGKWEFLPRLSSRGIRAIPEDVEKAVTLTNVRHLNMSNSTSEQMKRGKYQGKFLKDSIIKSMTDALDLAKKKGISDCWRETLKMRPG